MPVIVNCGKATSELTSLSAYSASAEKQITENPCPKTYDPVEAEANTVTKRRREHYLDIWEELISPEMLADKLEAFDNIRRSLPSGPRRHVKASETVNDGRQVSFRKSERPPKREHSHQVPSERSPLRCYGCGKQGVIKSRCPTCNLSASQRTDVATNHINAYTAQTKIP
ncbi:uncharacterized protein TNCV_944321 [Trichonephila clavipes]|nr:uncharacterized protein TNCV_944321 [Trichonephila clavipes]